MGLKVVRRPYEPIGQVCRRLKKLLEKSGTFHKLKEKETYKKPSEQRRDKKRRKERTISKAKLGKPEETPHWTQL